MDRLVFDTIGYTPVAIKYVINEAVVLAHFDGRASITYRDFTLARETHEWGLQPADQGACPRRSGGASPTTRRATATPMQAARASG